MTGGHVLSKQMLYNIIFRWLSFHHVKKLHYICFKHHLSAHNVIFDEVHKT